MRSIIILIVIIGLVEASEAFTLERLGQHFDAKFGSDHWTQKFAKVSSLVHDPQFSQTIGNFVKAFVGGAIDLYHNIAASVHG